MRPGEEDWSTKIKSTGAWIMSWIHLKGHWYHPLSSNCSEELGDTQSLYSRPLILDVAFALLDQMQMSLGLRFGLSLAIPHIRKVHQSLYETCTSTSAKLMMQWANSKKIRPNYFYNTFTCLPMFWINIPQIEVFTCTVLFTVLMRCSCGDWPHVVPKSLFYDCSYVITLRTVTDNHVPTQTDLHIHTI